MWSPAPGSSDPAAAFCRTQTLSVEVVEGLKAAVSVKAPFLSVLSSATKNQVCEGMWNGTSATLQSHWNPPRGSQLVTSGPACCAAPSPWLRDGGDAGRLCGFSTSRFAFCRFDAISASSCASITLCVPREATAFLSHSLTRGGSQVINGINPVVYYCWLACYYR